MVDQRRSLPIDNFRAIAVLMVIAGHYFGFQGYFDSTLITKQLLSNTPAGVDIFFAISGYLLGGQLLDVTPSYTVIKHFYLRRLIRTLPLYLFIIALSWSAAPPAERLALLTFTQNIYWLTHGSQASFAGVTWSLAVEEQFYLVLPALIFLIPRRQLSFVLVVLAFGSAALRSLLLDQGNDIAPYTAMPCRMDALLLGVAVAWRERKSPSKLQEPGLFRSQRLAFIGQRSYSLYLLHLPCGAVITATLGHTTLAGVGALALTVLISHASFTLIEHPAHQWGRARWPLRNTQAPAFA